MGNLTKRELVVRISEETGVVQRDVARIIQKTLDIIVENLKEDRNVEFRNFGVFEVIMRKARIGRNPNHPEQVVEIPARRTVKFKPGMEMRKDITNAK